VTIDSHREFDADQNEGKMQLFIQFS
jgi:hypothetical protein